MSSPLRFRFDPGRVEPLLRELASASESPRIQSALVRGLSAWPGVALSRVWLPGTLHTPFGSPELAAISKSGAALHVRDHLPKSGLGASLEEADWVMEKGIRGLGAHPLGDRSPHGVLLVFTRVPLEEDAFGWLGRVAAHATIALKRHRQPVLTSLEFKHLERENLMKALDTCEGKIFGEDGAATLLGMKPTTLASRLKALGIQKLPKASSF